MLEEKDLQAIRAIMKEETDLVRQDLRQEMAAMEDRLDTKMDARLKDMEDRLDTKMDVRLKDMEDRLDTKTDARLKDMEDRLDAKIAETGQDIMRNASVLMEQEFRRQFNLLAENQQIILEKLAPLDDLEVLETRVSALEAMVKKINRELAQLKKVQ